MIIRGKVIGVNPEKSTVTILAGRPSACAHGCDNCASCDNANMQITVFSRQRCEIGDIVEAQVSDKPPMGALAAVYLFPVGMLFLIFILAYIIKAVWAISILAVVGAVSVYLILKLINKAFKDRVQGEIINLIKSEKST